MEAAAGGGTEGAARRAVAGGGRRVRPPARPGAAKLPSPPSHPRGAGGPHATLRPAPHRGERRGTHSSGRGWRGFEHPRGFRCRGLLLVSVFLSSLPLLILFIYLFLSSCARQEAGEPPCIPVTALRCVGGSDAASGPSPPRRAARRRASVPAGAAVPSSPLCSVHRR